MLALLPLIMLSTMPLSSNADEGCYSWWYSRRFSLQQFIESGCLYSPRVAFTFKDNICPTKPCANGGDCYFNAQVGSYTCFCHCGYRGANCTINPPGTCSEYSCGQRGKCVTESRKRGRLRQNTCTFTRCQCEVAWMRGYRCEQDWSKCYTNGTFCGGNGRCKRQQSDDSYSCNCYEGFTGPQCLEKVLKKSSIASSENFLFNFAKILLGIILFGAVFQLLYLLVDERLKNGLRLSEQRQGRETMGTRVFLRISTSEPWPEVHSFNNEEELKLPN